MLVNVYSCKDLMKCLYNQEYKHAHTDNCTAYCYGTNTFAFNCTGCHAQNHAILKCTTFCSYAMDNAWHCALPTNIDV